MKALAFFILYPIGMILLVWIHPALLFILLVIVATQSMSKDQADRRTFESTPEATERDLGPYWVAPQELEN